MDAVGKSFPVDVLPQKVWEFIFIQTCQHEVQFV